jgi:hypothetical protein
MLETAIAFPGDSETTEADVEDASWRCDRVIRSFLSSRHESRHRGSTGTGHDRNHALQQKITLLIDLLVDAPLRGVEPWRLIVRRS